MWCVLNFVFLFLSCQLLSFQLCGCIWSTVLMESSGFLEWCLHHSLLQICYQVHCLVSGLTILVKPKLSFYLQICLRQEVSQHLMLFFLAHNIDFFFKFPFCIATWGFPSYFSLNMPFFLHVASHAAFVQNNLIISGGSVGNWSVCRTCNPTVPGSSSALTTILIYLIVVRNSNPWQRLQVANCLQPFGILTMLF